MNTSTQVAVPPAAGKTSLVRAIFAGSAGNILEWFDYSLYGFFASAISTNFFPAKDPITSLMVTFIVFGVGFFARPLGGIIFGHYADKIGRKNTLAVTIGLIGGATFVMGLLPTYAQIGIAAPILLTALRILQGVAVGGEWGSCVSFLTEYAKPQNRALIASFSQIGAAIGLLLGAMAGMLLSSILSPADLTAWGWRLAFFSGLLVAIFGYYVRKSVAETPAFQEKIDNKALSESPLKDAFRDYKKEMITVFFLVGGANVTYWLILNFMSTYISRFLKLPMTTGFSLTVLSLIAFTIALPIGGWLADRYGRKPMILIGAGSLAFLGYPLFQVLAQTGSYPAMASVVCALTVIFAAFQGGFNVGIAELFPTAIRCSGFSVPYQLACAVFGGTAMAIVTWLYGLTDNVMVVPMYMCGIMFVVFLTGLFLFEETKGKPLG